MRQFLIFLAVSAFALGALAMSDQNQSQPTSASNIISVRVGPGDKAEFTMTKVNGQIVSPQQTEWKPVDANQIYNPDTVIPAEKFGSLLFMKDPNIQDSVTTSISDSLVQARGRVYRPYVGGRGYNWGGNYYPYYYPYYYSPTIPYPNTAYPYVPNTTYPYTYPYVCGTYGAWPYIYYNYCY